MATSTDVIEEAPGPAPEPPATSSSATLGGEKKRSVEQITLLLFIVLPFLAVLAAVPLAWGWG